jgi:hypothetical protein
MLDEPVVWLRLLQLCSDLSKVLVDLLLQSLDALL